MVALDLYCVVLLWLPISDGSKVRLMHAALAAAQAKCDRIDKELAAIKFMDLTEQRRLADQRLSELVDTIYDD
jgi:hypothetical protein